MSLGQIARDRPERIPTSPGDLVYMFPTSGEGMAVNALIYFLIWGVLIFLMMRFGCGAHVMGGRHAQHRTGDGQETSRDLRWVAPETDTDPVCGKTVRTETARPTVHDGTVYYFCSRECREAFEAAPDLYTGQGPGTPKQLEKSNV